MARRMIVVQHNSDIQLVEVAAHDELQLQDRVKRNPELLPVDELGLGEPLLVVGRETTLASGAVDLIAVTPDGDIVIVEFKTGPQNPDFRSALAQLLDYGSDLWQLTLEEFESAVAVRYFKGKHCPAGSPAKGLGSLEAAAAATWPDLEPSAHEQFSDRLRENLTRGSFHYLVVAQRFTAPMEATVNYLNAIASPARFSLIELVRFAGGGIDAFEARTILRPQATPKTAPGPTASEATFLESIADHDYREACHALFELCRVLNLRFEWGARGTSIRIEVNGKLQPVSIAWAFPPGVSGWMGLTDLTFGFDGTLTLEAESRQLLETYVAKMRAVPGSQQVTRAGLQAVTLHPADVVAHQTAISEIVAALAAEMSGEGAQTEF